MELNTHKRGILSWTALVFLLISLAILQSSVLAGFLKASFMPHFLWPPLFYCFLQRAFLESLFLTFFISSLSSVFLSNSAPQLFLIYLSGFIAFMLLKKILLSQSLAVFFILTLIFSFYFSFLIEKSFYTPDRSAWIHIVSYFYKAVVTSALATLLLPVLKKHFPPVEEI